MKGVICNQAADLDSVACAVVYAEAIGAKAIVPIPREDLRLRPEVEFLLEKANYPQESILFSGEFDICSIENLVLVDHNVLPKGLERLNSKIAEVIDHHCDECILPVRKKIARTGSCASLVALRMAEMGKIPDANQALMLMGAILVDTRNLAEGHPTDSEDLDAAKVLMQKVNIDRDALFKVLWKIKMDLSKFTPQELLRKDYKEVESDAVKMGFSTIYSSLERLSHGVMAEAERFRVKKGLDYLVIMTADYSGGSVQKEFAILPNCREATEHLNRHGADLVPKMQICGIEVYDMRNTAYSRKQVLPALYSACAGL